MAQSWLTVYLLGSFGDGFLPVLVQIESDLDAILSEIAGSAFHSNANLRNFSRHVCTEFLDTSRVFTDGNGRIVLRSCSFLSLAGRWHPVHLQPTSIETPDSARMLFWECRGRQYYAG
jgi:hypothetical protein